MLCLQRPQMMSLVDMLENFARSGATLALLGSFDSAPPTEMAHLPTIPDKQDMRNKEGYDSSMTKGKGLVSDWGNHSFFNLRQAPFDLRDPLEVFPMPEGFGAKSGDDAKVSDRAKSGEGEMPDQQLLLYSGEYLRRQDFAKMRKRVGQFLAQH